MSVLFEFAMFPTDKGESVSNYVSKIIKMVRESNIKYKLTPMGTIVETESMEQALELIQKAYAQLEPDCSRIYCTAKFDIRKGPNGRMEQKINSIENKIGNVSL